MSHQGGQESQPGYMDGVCVKISEQYKPPPRINLAISCSQRLSLNQQLQDNIQLYDFSLEAKTKDCMNDLKNTRKVTLQNKRDKLEKIRAARKKQMEELEASKVVEPSTVSDLEGKSIEQCTCEASQVKTTTDILYPTYSRILMPTPLVSSVSQSHPAANYNATDYSSFNIADFEADTSSPFDNMELKTLNDIEELAQVLKTDTTEDKTYKQVYTNYVPPTTSEPTNYISDCNTTYPGYTIPQEPTTSVCTTMYNINGFYYSPNQNYTNYTYNSSFEPLNPDDLKVTSHKNITEISKTLNDTQISNRLEKSKEIVKNKVDETFELLPKNLQQLSQNISLMGFPLPRVARACQALGDDQKKVVEHLLVMSELLDLGFSEKDVSSALIQCNNDRDRALDILIM